MLEALFLCLAPVVTDGDSLRCGTERIRLASIDAPEISTCPAYRTCTPGDGQASKRALAAMVQGRRVECQRVGVDRYGRTLARCSADGVDLSCAMVAGGWAVVRYSRLRCR